MSIQVGQKKIKEMDLIGFWEPVWRGVLIILTTLQANRLDKKISLQGFIDQWSQIVSGLKQIFYNFQKRDWLGSWLIIVSPQALGTIVRALGKTRTKIWEFESYEVLYREFSSEWSQIVQRANLILVTAEKINRGELPSKEEREAILPFLDKLNDILGSFLHAWLK